MSRTIIRVDMAALSVSRDVVPLEYQLLGGRALTSRIVNDEVPALCHPLRRHNKIVFAPGLLSATTAPSSSRISVGGKSPLTGGIKESNGGGDVSARMAKLGIKALVLEELPADGTLHVLVVDKDGARLEPGEAYRGLGTRELHRALHAAYGQKIGISCIGPAGEFRMQTAGISNSDQQGEPGRYSARGGLGAVMGSKGLKAIVIDDAGAEFELEYADKDAFRDAVRLSAQAMKEGVISGELMRKRGTHINEYIDEVGAIPTRNFSTGRYEHTPTMTGWTMYETIRERGGEGRVAVGCSKGCLIQCMSIYAGKDGKVLSQSIEYESGVLLGSNLGIDNWDDVAVLNDLCNDIGLDTMETGAALGVLMEAGVLDFGDGPSAARVLEEARSGLALGRIVGMGADGVGKAYGVTRVPTVKGQSMAAYDPRGIKGMGVTYATSPMGADHTAGFTVAPEVFGLGGNPDPLSNQGKDALSRDYQVGAAVCDALGLCAFTGFAAEQQGQAMVDMVNAQYGTEWAATELNELGRKALLVEREFNKAAGFTAAADRLPEFFREEPLAPHDAVFDVSDADLDAVYDIWES